MRNDLQAHRRSAQAQLKIVETPPGAAGASPAWWPRSTASRTIAMKNSCWPPTRCGPAWPSSRAWSMSIDVREAAQRKLMFVTDKEKAALNGITTEQIAGTLQTLLVAARWA